MYQQVHPLSRSTDLTRVRLAGRIQTQSAFPQQNGGKPIHRPQWRSQGMSDMVADPFEGANGVLQIGCPFFGALPQELRVLSKLRLGLLQRLFGPLAFGDFALQSSCLRRALANARRICESGFQRLAPGQFLIQAALGYAPGKFILARS